MVSLLTPRSWESKSALLAHLGDCKPRSLVIGLDAEAPRTYASFSIATNHGQGELGVISSGLGTDVAAVLMHDGRRALVGHDTWLTWIDVQALTLVTSQRLGGVFFEFLPVDGDAEIVVLHELGALRVDASGAVKWSVDTDVVEDWSTDAKGNLILEVMDATRFVISLDSGAVSRSSHFEAR
jgi:hypothetical protein